MALNLNYTPNALVNTATLTEDQWLAWRRKGIGGSDVASALGISPNDYTDAEVEQIIGALEQAVHDLRERFAGKRSFSLHGQE